MTPLAKRFKHGALWTLKQTGAFALAGWLTRKKIRILCYHGVWIGEPLFAGDSMFMSRPTFAGRLDLLIRQQYCVTTLTNALAGLCGPRPVVLTIDDGWQGAASSMLSELGRRNLTALIYCDTENLVLGGTIPHVAAGYLRKLDDGPRPSREVEVHFLAACDRSLSPEERLQAVKNLAELVGVDPARLLESRMFAYMSPRELRDAHATGFEVGLHTHTHNLGSFSAAEVEREIGQNRATLAAILGVPERSLVHFCYPSGIWVDGIDSQLAALGIATATTLEPFLASTDQNRFFLPRIVDGEQLSALEFEAELAGVGHCFRVFKRKFIAIARRRLEPADGPRPREALNGPCGATTARATPRRPHRGSPNDGSVIQRRGGWTS
jgi:peptidoglycan/xylan/chitin deacetylase (PgdA/CDA1 family)